MMKHRKWKREWTTAYLFIAPMVIGTFIFGILPIFYSVAMSFMKWDGLGAKAFIGFRNFYELFHTEKFVFELKNTAIYSIVTVPVTMLLSLGVANLLNRGLRGTGFFRVIYFLPNIVMPVAATMVWKWLLNSKFGVVNYVLRALHLPTPSWISDPKVIMVSLVVITVWVGVGYNAIIMLAGLQGIPSSLHESAKLDGASDRQIFWKITVPLLTPTLFFLLTMSIMNSLRAFDIIYTFIGNQSGALADASRTIVYGIYERAFSFMNMGLASAEAFILLLIILVITLIQFKLQDKWVFYD